MKPLQYSQHWGMVKEAVGADGGMSINLLQQISCVC